MSWTYSQELAEAFSPPSSLDTEHCARSRSIAIVDRYCSNARETLESITQYGTISGPSIQSPGSVLSSSYREVGLAQTYPPQERRPACQGRTAGSTSRSFAWLEQSDQNGSSWKTFQRSFTAGWESYSQSWPRCGTLAAGVCSELGTLARHIEEIGYGSWQGERMATPTSKANQLAPQMIEKHPGCRAWLMYPSPMAGHGKSGMYNSGDSLHLRRLVDAGKLDYGTALTMSCGGLHHKNLSPWREAQLAEHIRQNGRRFSGAKNGGSLSPRFPEFLMMWPAGWTSAEPLGMDGFQLWLRMHSEFLSGS